jgi:hypothetical protein
MLHGTNDRGPFRYVALILTGFIFAFFVGEISVRIASGDHSDPQKYHDIVSAEDSAGFWQSYSKPNSDFVYCGQTGVKKEFETHGRTNSIGFYDKEYAFEKPVNVFRILVIGDSFVEALQLPLKKNLHKVLERRLNETYPGRKFEVIGLGRSGNGPRYNFEFFRDIGIKYNPNIVISEFLPENDLRNDSVSLQVLFRRQVEELRKVALSYRPGVFHAELPLLNNSKLIQLLGQSILNLKFKAKRKQLPLAEQIPVDLCVYSREYDAQWQRAWKSTLAQIRAAKQLADEHHIQYVLVNFGERFKIDRATFDLFLKSNPAIRGSGWDFDRPDKIIRSFCQEENIRLLELGPLFQAEFARTNTPLYFKYDGHWNEAGHRYAAEKILEYLERNHLLQD